MQAIFRVGRHGDRLLLGLGSPSSALTLLSSLSNQAPLLCAWRRLFVCSSSAVGLSEQQMTSSESPASHSVVAVKAPLSQQRHPSCQRQVQAEELGFCSSDFHLMQAHKLRSMGLKIKS